MASSSQIFLNMVDHQIPQGITPEQRALIQYYVESHINDKQLSNLYHTISSIEQSSLLDEMDGLPVESVLEANGSIAVALSGIRLFWYKLNEREIYQIETNTDVNRCILVALLDF